MAYERMSFASTSADEAEQFMADHFGSSKLHWPDFRGVRQTGVRDDRFFLSDGFFGCSLVSTFDPDRLFVTRTTNHCRWEEGRDSGDLLAMPKLFRPGHASSFGLADCGVRTLVLDRPSLERTARLLYGQDDLALDFDGPDPVDAAASRRWLSAVDLAWGYVSDGSLADDLVRSNVYRLLAVTTLEAFRFVGDPSALRASATRQLRIHRTAVDFLHDHASLPITIDDAARAAGATVPELESAFRAHETEHTSPTEYLRAVRLSAAHRDLVAGDPTRGDTVAAIGRRWGFASPSRFAERYRSAYGVTPKWVLDRQRCRLRGTVRREGRPGPRSGMGQTELSVPTFSTKRPPGRRHQHPRCCTTPRQLPSTTRTRTRRPPPVRRPPRARLRST